MSAERGSLTECVWQMPQRNFERCVSSLKNDTEECIEPLR